MVIIDVCLFPARSGTPSGVRIIGKTVFQGCHPACMFDPLASAPLATIYDASGVAPDMTQKQVATNPQMVRNSVWMVRNSSCMVETQFRMVFSQSCLFATQLRIFPPRLFCPP